MRVHHRPSDPAPKRGGWVCTVTDGPNGILHIGVTSGLDRRAWGHRAGVYPGFTRRCGLGRLVRYAPYDAIRAAIRREHNAEHWSQAWKVRVVLDMNPDESSLLEMLNA